MQLEKESGSIKITFWKATNNVFAKTLEGWQYVVYCMLIAVPKQTWPHKCETNLEKQFLDCNPTGETCDYECNPAISNKRTRFIQAHNRVGHSHILTVAKFFRLATHKMSKLSAFYFLHKTIAACSLTPYLTNSLQHISKELFIENTVLF